MHRSFIFGGRPFYLLEEGRDIREMVLERNWLTREELEKVLDPERITSPQGVDTQLRDEARCRLKKET